MLGTNLVFIHESNYKHFKFSIYEEIEFQLGEFIRKNPSCYGHFNCLNLDHFPKPPQLMDELFYSFNNVTSLQGTLAQNLTHTFTLT